jgi:hypothetical protein
MRVDFKAAVEKCGLTLDALDSYFKFPAGTMSDIQRELTNFADPKNKHLVEEWRNKPQATDTVAAAKPGEKATPATSIQAAQTQRVKERLDGLNL